MLMNGDATEFRGADGREVGWVGEQKAPAEGKWGKLFI